MRFNYFILSFIIIITCHKGVFSQQGVGIGINRPDASSVLHVDAEANNKGILFPRLTSAQANNISTPANGLVVFDTDRRSLAFNDSLGDASGIKWVEVIPQGIITMWSGASIPHGWALCNGNWYNPLDNSDQGPTTTPNRTVRTPDLRGRFIVASGQNQSPATGDSNPNYAVNTAGISGRNEVPLTINEMPSHAHGVVDPGHNHTMQNNGNHTHNVSSGGNRGPGGGGREPVDYNAALFNSATNSSGSHSHTVNNTQSDIIIQNEGSGNFHENRPPYYVLAFIMKL